LPWLRAIGHFEPVVDFLEHLMDATSLLVDKDEICGSVQILQNNVEINHKLLLGDKLDPLN